MEDIIEERSIVKLCGYILCSKPLSVIICQQYHISTRNNKVYDISKRKKFCSSSCYGAANFLLEQMLESPLWLREKDDIPVFQILPVNVKQHVLGDEIDVAGIKLVNQNIDIDNAECVKESKKDDNEYNKESLEVKQTRKNRLSDISNLKKESIHSSTLLNSETNNISNVSENIDPQDLFSDNTYLSELRLNKKNEDCESIKLINRTGNCDNKIQKVDIKLDNLDVEIIKEYENMPHSCEDNIRNTDKNTNINTTCKNDCKTDRTQPQLNEINIQTKINKTRPNRCKKVQFQLNESNSKNNNGKSIIQTQLNEINSCQNGDNNKLQFYPDKLYNDQNDNKQLEYQVGENTENNCKDNKKIIQPYLFEEYTNNIVTSTSGYNPEEKKHNNKSSKNKKCKQKEFGSAETHVNCCYLLVMRVEQNVREWITENTLRLLLGGEDEKCKLLESLAQHDRYEQLCKKLNRLQLEDEREDCIILEKNMLKPLPHFSVLQEEGKKMELKVRAFYEGRTIFEDSNNESENKNDEDDEPVLPLTASHTPNAIRRRIFLDKLNKILPDLLRALTSNTNCSIAEFTYNNEKYSLIKILISTFNLSAANIVFRAAEWTLVGLLIIKMLSLIDVQMKSLLQTKQATLYTSMILMSYKLDSSYLDRLIMEVTNSMDIN
ncbi:putative RNA polymerase II subunit B1 CTD phosphatase RPAP2 isoform X2 [Pseudomyrmex gracilis]|nr:putative RNA polymerase II subunit B1 CTD phosphatase RPAP2 isoform X2 [Pseudomyrmex gracilis]